ncbi:hypothetical protein QN414_32685, partial [Pseudomonas sp. 5S1]
MRLLLVMHLHDRHGAHLTLQTPLKQARQSPVGRRLSGLSEEFPYSIREGLNPMGFAAYFVNIPLPVSYTHL